MAAWPSFTWRPSGRLFLSRTKEYAPRRGGLQIRIEMVDNDNGPRDVAGLDNIQLSSVPIPATVWLFGSGLLGLIGIARRKKTS